MHQFIDFVLRHYILSSVFIILIISLIVYEAINQGYGSRMGAQELVGKMNSGAVKVFDIRDKSAYASGHIIDSQCVTADELKSENGPLRDLAEQIAVIVCNNGQKSGVLVGKIKAASKNNNVALLAGGISEWSKQSLPLTKGKK